MRYHHFVGRRLSLHLLRAGRAETEQFAYLLCASGMMGACVLVGCAGEPRSTAAELPQSTTCTVLDPPGRAGEQAQLAIITMNNDGGWCGYLRWTTMGGRVFGAPMRVTQAPAHGQVDIAVQAKGTRISYRPEAGFAGTDHFSVVNIFLNFDRPYSVTVSP